MDSAWSIVEAVQARWLFQQASGKAESDILDEADKGGAAWQLGKGTVEAMVGWRQGQGQQSVRFQVPAELLR